MALTFGTVLVSRGIAGLLAIGTDELTVVAPVVTGRAGVTRPAANGVDAVLSLVLGIALTNVGPPLTRQRTSNGRHCASLPQQFVTTIP